MKLKKYTRILLSPNVENPNRHYFNVNKTVLNKLDRLKNSGGFKRFSIDIEDEVEAYTNDHAYLKRFLVANNLGF